LLWQVPLQDFDAAVKVIALAGAMTTFFTPFTCSADPTMVALAEPVPVAIPLWQSEQLKELPEWVECLPELGGAPWQDVQVMAPPVQSGIAVVAPPVKLPWQ
jgi:hypothetical protein